MSRSGDLTPTRVVDLDAIDAGEGAYMPMRVELLAGVNLVRVRARVRPVISWLDLFDHIFRELKEHPVGAMPLDVLSYTLVDVRARQRFAPIERVTQRYCNHVLGIHQTEFNGALNRDRRMRLVVDMLQELPWPAEQGAEGAGDAAGEEEERQAPPADRAELEAEEPSLNVVVDDDVLTTEDSLPALEDEAPPSGAWSQWHRAYGADGLSSHRAA